MTVLRVSKDKNNPYVILNKKFLEDPAISLKLKGFLAYCLTKPDDWKFSVSHLKKVLKEGRGAIYSIIEEGITHGYITREEQETDEKGRFGPTEYVIHENKIQKKITVSGNPDAENPDPDIGTLLINKILNNEETDIKKTPSKEGVKESPFKIERAPWVKTSKEEHCKLIEKYGQSITDEAYKHLSEWKDDVPKTRWRKSDYLAILRWVIQALEKKGLKIEKLNEEKKGKSTRWKPTQKKKH